MLSKKQIRMLQILDKQVSTCRICDIYKNGCLVPFWTKSSKYVIIGEVPGFNEIRKQTPFIGAAGEILTQVLNKSGLDAKDFLILHTIQCRPDSRNNVGSRKPTEVQVKNCQSYLRKYIKVLQPEKILCLGNYAKYLFTGNFQGVLKERGTFNECTLDGSNKIYPVLFTIHPAYCIYNTEDGVPMLREDIEIFKDTVFEVQVDWLFSEDEFKI